MPYFYGYENELRAVLENDGAEVYLVNSNIHTESFPVKLLMFYTSGLREWYTFRYYQNKLKDCPEEIDEVLVIKGQWLTEKVIGLLKERFRNARFTIYQWDSVATFPDQCRLAAFFERVFTFDPVDADHYNWKYRPLFFNPAMVRREESRYDMSFLCSMHTKRLQILSQAAEIAARLNKRIYSYIYVPPLQYIRNLLTRNPLYNGNRKAMHFMPLSKKDTMTVYHQTACLIDYTFPDQKGLSMRTIEALGHRCKLATNNKEVLKTDFYDPDNILIYEPEHMEIPENWLQTPYKNVADGIYERYTIKGFIRELLEDQTGN